MFDIIQTPRDVSALYNVLSYRLLNIEKNWKSWHFWL